MKPVSKIVMSAVAIAAFSACGGGGGGDSGSSTPAPVKFTQADVQSTAGLGVDAVLVTSFSLNDLTFILGGLIDALALDVGGSRVVTEAWCASGTASAELVKSVSRTGLANGDQVTLTFAQCSVGQSSNVMNGVVRMTAQGDVLSYSSSDYSVSFQANATDLSLTQGTLVGRHNGVLNIQAGRIGGTQAFNNLVVPAGQAFTSVVSRSSSQPVTLGYAAGTSFASTDDALAHEGTRKLDGSVTTSVSLGSVALVISMPTAFAGSATTTTFVPSTGVINTLSTLENMATTTTVHGTTATVSGDSDGNGSQDLSFETSWASLAN